MPLQIVKMLDPINNVVITGGLVPLGAYNAGTDYAVGDAVSYNGSSYVMYSNAGAGTLPTNTTYWMLLADKGATGATGANGEGVATGGTTGQILAKASNTNFDTEWVDNTGGSGVSEALVIAYSIAL